MANTGVYIELKGDKFKKSNKEALSLAKGGAGDVVAVIFSNDLSPYAADLKGIKKVVQVKGDNLEYQPDIYAATLAQVIKDNSLTDFIGTASPQGKDLFPRVAAKLQTASLINDCIEVNFADSLVTKPLYAGKLLCQFKVNDEYRLYTGCFEAVN